MPCEMWSFLQTGEWWATPGLASALGVPGLLFGGLVIVWRAYQKALDANQTMARELAANVALMENLADSHERLRLSVEAASRR